jgi:hypothetical protein
MKDAFLSEEDLDLRNLDREELIAVWNAWLLQAQATNDVDEHLYSHGVFREVPLAARTEVARVTEPSERRS